MLASLERLAKVYRILEAAGCGEYLMLDLGELRGFDYYDGMVFDVFAEGVGYDVGGGGRYDHLIGRFGRMLPSTGFAFDVDRLFRVLDGVDAANPAGGVDCLLTGPARLTGAVMTLAQRLRVGGASVVQGAPLVKGPAALGESLSEARRLGVRTVVWLGVSPLGSEDVLIVAAPGRVASRPSPTVSSLRKQGARVMQAADLSAAELVQG